MSERTERQRHFLSCSLQLKIFRGKLDPGQAQLGKIDQFVEYTSCITQTLYYGLRRGDCRQDKKREKFQYNVQIGLDPHPPPHLSDISDFFVFHTFLKKADPPPPSWINFKHFSI